MSIMSEAVDLIRRSAEADTDEDKIDRISIYIKMYRAGIDREKIGGVLKDLVGKGSLEAAWAVVELKLKDSDDDYKHEEIFGSMVNGETGK